MSKNILWIADEIYLNQRLISGRGQAVRGEKREKLGWSLEKSIKTRRLLVSTEITQDYTPLFTILQNERCLQRNKGKLLNVNNGLKQNKQLLYLSRTFSLTASRVNHVIGFCCILQKFIAN